jgi:hypothetical protein
MPELEINYLLFTVTVTVLWRVAAATQVRVVEPLATFGLAYLSYLAADLFNWSGILSLIGTWGSCNGRQETADLGRGDKNGGLVS